MSMGRTIMQEAASDEFRARIMSVFWLANMGGMPVGALLMGFCTEYLGVLYGFLMAAVGMWGASITVITFGNSDEKGAV